MSSRTKICKITIGSNLYGTNRPESDMDISGVFLPSEDDMLGLQNCPAEMSESVKVSDGPRNSIGDVDCKFYSLQRFFNLAAQGQPGQLELLFAPLVSYHHVPGADYEIPIHPAWKEVLDNKHLFLSRKGITPFVGFALSQSHKTTLKGDNYNQLIDILMWGSHLSSQHQQMPLKTWMIEEVGVRPGYHVLMCAKTKTKWSFELKENDHHFSCLWIAGRQYDPGLRTKTFLKSIQTLVDKYGTRSKAAAADGLDFKSLMHSYRLLGEAEEFMATSAITLPRPPEEVKKLLDIRAGNIPEDFDWQEDIQARITKIRTEVEPTSPLPKEPNYSKLNELHKSIMKKHLKG